MRLVGEMEIHTRERFYKDNILYISHIIYIFIYFTYYILLHIIYFTYYIFHILYI